VLNVHPTLAPQRSLAPLCAEAATLTLCLYAKRLELPRARFVWPQTDSGTITLTAPQVAMLLEGIDWRMPAWTARPEVAV
jgi:transposase